MNWRQIGKLTIAAVLGVILFPSASGAVSQSSSTDFQVNEVFFGAGGALNNCSTSFCAQETAGETAVGSTTSADYKAQAGFNTGRNPYLQFIVNGTNTDVGGLSTGSATTTTATFSVKNYLSSGYSVVTVSNPPKNNTYTMTALSTPTSSVPGTEQFGINLVANTGFGANPVQVPSSGFSYGQPTANYATTNKFKYVPGDTIAYSNSSSGETDFTISYIYNISNLTPGGLYNFNDVLVATATF